MKISLFFLVVVLLAGCQRNNSSITQAENVFKPLVEEELSYVSKNIEGLENDKGKEWYKGDSIFFANWLKGANEELAGNFNKAIAFYTNALKTKRYEISSYEVKLSMGRVYLQMNDTLKAKKMLTEFKQEAKKDLTGDEVEWGLTDEAKESLTRDVEDCDYLLGMIDEKKL